MKKNCICPNCKSYNVIEIVYGDPTDELIEEHEKGNVYLAGCIFDWMIQVECVRIVELLGEKQIFLS